MLSHYITQGLTHLRQPRLERPFSQNMLRDGLPTPPLLNGVDAIFCEDAVRQIMCWQMPSDLPIGTRREDRWRAVSSLQKAIRRGEVRAAMVAAHAAFGMDPAYLRRRLVVCAVEDVGLGNLYAVAATLALAGDVASRRLAGEAKTSVWLAAQLASGWKDRSACNMCVLVDLNRDLHPTMREWTDLPCSELAAKATNIGRPVEERMLAAWLLAGTKRFRGANLPPGNDRPRWPLMRLMVQSGMPLILYWLADRAAVRGGDAMFISLLPVWQMVGDGEQEVELRRPDLSADPGVGPLLACAYDMYTREGRRALGRFAKLEPVAHALEALEIENRTPALHVATFVAEGGQLNARVSLPPLDAAHSEAIRRELNYFGADTLRAQAALVRAVSENLCVLNAHRDRVVQNAPAAIDSPRLASHSLLAAASNTPRQAFLPFHEAPATLKGPNPVTKLEQEIWLRTPWCDEA